MMPSFPSPTVVPNRSKMLRGPARPAIVQMMCVLIDEQPAAPALDREMGCRVWDVSMQMAGLT
jgi:hypothetical protein